MDSTAKLPKLPLQCVREKSSKLYAKPLAREIISCILNTFRTILTVFSFSGQFLTVNTVVYAYRDNEPVAGRI